MRTLLVNADIPSFINGPTVTLNVGLPAKAFYIHRDLLCRESSVFKAAFSESGHFLEARRYAISFALQYHPRWILWFKIELEILCER